MTHPLSNSRKIAEARFTRFVFAGGVAAICNFGSRFIYSLFVDFGVAVVLAYITGMAVAYALNKLFVFTKSNNTVHHEVTWFVLVNLFAVLQTWALSVYLAGVLPPYMPLDGEQGVALAEAVAHIAGIMLPVFTSYLGHKYITFRE
ncbi:MAG: GtrA family protein [Halioglobus sp.]|nr:GtrA family protein [Halioglobus sp.]